MQPPEIDNRSAADLTAHTEALVTRLTGWQPPDGPDGDPGRALAGIFGHFAGLVVERLNQLPDKNFLAFLNLVGAEPLAPTAARAPLAFTLVDGAPVDGVVPAGTQVAAPPRHGDDDEAVFETEQDLIVTRSRLVALRVYDPWTDRTADVLAPPDDGATGGAGADAGAGPGDGFDAGWGPFTGTGPVEHEWYLACDDLLADAAGRPVTVEVVTPDQTQWRTWAIEWSVRSGGDWQPFLPTGATSVTQDGERFRWRVVFPALPELEEWTVGGVSARWLRARLAQPLPPDREALTIAEAGPVPEERPTPVTFPAELFPDGTVEWYLDGGEVFGRSFATCDLTVTVADGARATTDLVVTWEYLSGTGSAWRQLGETRRTAATGLALPDTTGCLTTSGRISFTVPHDWPWAEHGNRRGRWLRARITAGRYTTAPTLTDLRFGWRWHPPRVERIEVTVPPALGADPSQALPPELGSTNGIAVDLGRDHTPFGPAPAYNDAFFVACEPVLSQPGAKVEVTVTLTNPAGVANTPVPAVRTAGNPVVAWEIHTATGWRTMVRSPAAPGPQSLTQSGTVTISVPEDVTPVAVGGEERNWLRLRLVGGNFGEPATYAEVRNGDTVSYRPVAATLAPPVLTSLRFKVISTSAPAVSATSRPVTACITSNGGEVVDHTATLSSGGSFAPFVPLATRHPALYLGFDQPFAPRPVNLFFSLAPPRPEDVAAEMLLAPGTASWSRSADRSRSTGRARIAWEYSSGSGWSPLGALDGTVDLTRSGLIRFVGPGDQTRRPWLGEDLHWVVARWHDGDFPTPPRARQVRVNTVWASAAVTSRDEVLGSSTGEPHQRFVAVNTPVLEGEWLEVDEGAGVWTRWAPVVDFHGSGSGDRVYLIDRATGAITFGDGRRGRIPPLGQANVRLARYRSGGGANGNREPGEIVELKSSPSYIDGVVNVEAAGGGFDTEPLDRVKERGPAALRHRGRAVTARDVGDLAYATSPDVARVAVITPDFDSAQLWLAPDGRPRAGHRSVPSGRVGVIVVPHDTAPRPIPSLGLLDAVRAGLDRCSATGADVWVAGPEWVAVSVAARVAPVSPEDADSVTAAVRRRIDAFLHPLTGGHDGRGWSFGRVPHRSDLHRVLEATAGVDHVHGLTVSIEPLTTRGDVDELRAWLQRRSRSTATLTPDQREWNSWTQRSLIFPANHDIRPVLDA